MGKLEERYEAVLVRDGDDVGSNPSSNTPLAELAAARLERRAVLRGFASAAVAAGLGGTLTSKVALAAASEGSASSLGFASIPQTIGETHAVAPGYAANILIRWGDPVLEGAPAWDPQQQTADAQAKQFGHNCDYLAYFPLPRGSDSSEHGLLHVNHEYTSPELMFPGWTHRPEVETERPADSVTKASTEAQTAEQTRIEMMAHNGSVIEVRKEGGRWTVVPDSRYARRITLDTEMRVAGPAAGDARMKTNADPTGTRVFGTINNCAGGKTPWGTVLMAEENFHGYFGGGDPKTAPDAANYKRYGVTADARYPWHRTVERFDLAKEPNEPNRFGWMVEYDPYDPASVPVKRTALGRCKHEGATSIVNKDGRVVLYSGDDERFEYLYRFVTEGRFDAADPAANRDLLDRGTLSVARFDADKLTWLPLVHGRGELTEANGFKSQADVVIEARRAADLVGATPLDRPEDVQPNPVNGRVYVMLTNNTRRKPEQVDAVNPRAANAHGQVVELTPPGGEGKDADHAADEFAWSLFLLGGNPQVADSGAKYGAASEAWLSSPDNCAFDPAGRLWISTDQGAAQAKNAIPDGMFACDVAGDGRAHLKFFFAVPVGAEMCGPEFTPDGRTLFVAVQHPAETEDLSSNFETPSTRWPDFKDGVPPRPAVVAITKEDGGLIGA